MALNPFSLIEEKKKKKKEKRREKKNKVEVILMKIIISRRKANCDRFSVSSAQHLTCTRLRTGAAVCGGGLGAGGEGCWGQR